LVERWSHRPKGRWHGDAALFDQLQGVSQTAGDPQLRNQALQALARFRDPALVIRTLDYAMSSKVRNQDAVRLVRIEMSDRGTRDLAWQWVQQNWSRVQGLITTWDPHIGRIHGQLRGAEQPGHGIFSRAQGAGGLARVRPRS
jgi:hypothetical protein